LKAIRRGSHSSRRRACASTRSLVGALFGALEKGNGREGEDSAAEDEGLVPEDTTREDAPVEIPYPSLRERPTPRVERPCRSERESSPFPAPTPLHSTAVGRKDTTTSGPCLPVEWGAAGRRSRTVPAHQGGWFRPAGGRGIHHVREPSEQGRFGTGLPRQTRADNQGLKESIFTPMVTPDPILSGPSGPALRDENRGARRRRQAAAGSKEG
jgi:hypothetical protein